MKGVSDKDAQNDKKIKGKKNDVKKPLQVLHISKKDAHKGKDEVSDGNHILSKEIKTDIKTEVKPVKPQIIDSPKNEEKESYSKNINFENVSSICIKSKYGPHYKT